MNRYDFEFKDGGCGFCVSAPSTDDAYVAFAALCEEVMASADDYCLVRTYDSAGNITWDLFTDGFISEE